MTEEHDIQREYYKETASSYDRMHINEGDEHFKALKIVVEEAKKNNVKSLIDVGSGTGRALEYLLNSSFEVTGIEPSQDLRTIGIKRNKMLNDHLLDGNGYYLDFPNESFDAACAFGVLHHVKDPNKVVAEMLRVSKKMIFISDSNRFGQGQLFIQRIKWLLWKLGLWPLTNFIKTRGKGYLITEGDGLSYSYSVHDSYKLVDKWAMNIRVVSTSDPQLFDNADDFWLKASHVLMIGTKQE